MLPKISGLAFLFKYSPFGNIRLTLKGSSVFYFLTIFDQHKNLVLSSIYFETSKKNNVVFYL